MKDKDIIKTLKQRYEYLSQECQYFLHVAGMCSDEKMHDAYMQEADRYYQKMVEVHYLMNELIERK